MLWSSKKMFYLCTRNSKESIKSNYLCTRNQEITDTQIRIDSLAQQVEHNTFNVGVLGSSPSWITE
ncbi:unknown [Bacteroides thetaiotaomicron CAG:40]|nr:unknown [Bacteroides thetaiotaomicron CAG:40]